MGADVVRVFVLLCFCVMLFAAEGVAVELEAPKDVHSLLKQHVHLLKMDDKDIPEAGPDRSALVRRARREVAELLATEGYFSPDVRIDRSDAEHWRLVVEPGQRTVVAGVDIQFQGEIGEAAEGSGQEAYREKLRRDWSMPVDAPFRQADWEATKQVLLDALRSERYAAAKLLSSKADVDPEAGKVWFRLVLDSGPSFHFGALEVSGLHTLPADFVERYNTLKEGDVYRRSDLLAFQESLQTAPQLAVVAVSVDPDPQKAAAVPIRVAVTEAQPRRLGFGFGVSSNTGFRAETAFRHVNLLGYGWELTSGLRLEQRRQSLYTDFFLPPGRARHRDSAGLSFDRSDLEGLKVYTQAIGVARSVKRGNIETQRAARVQHEEIHPDKAEKSSYSTLTLNWSWVQRAVDDVLDPRRGHVLEAQVGGGVGLSPQARDFTRFYGRYQHYFVLGERVNVLALRGEAGVTLADSREGVPQDFLFRAGGTQSIRGFAYRSLGVKEGEATVGGRYFAAASAEYVRWIKHGAGVALFVDSGDAADSRESFRVHTGYGFGARWLSPAGPLTIDLAWGYKEKRPRLHFGVAVAF